MFRFTIRDVLWLTALAAVLVAWWISNSRQNTRARSLEARVSLSETAYREIFPPGWEGLTAAMRNERNILSYRASALKHELEKRGHTVVIVQDHVFVDPSADLLRSFSEQPPPGRP
jgi:hypothetical protein